MVRAESGEGNERERKRVVHVFTTRKHVYGFTRHRTLYSTGVNIQVLFGYGLKYFATNSYILN